MRRPFKKFVAAILICLAVLCSAVTSYAGTWSHDSISWWYSNNDTSYLANGWYWIDGNNDGIAECYDFKGDGYLYVAGKTPDGYTVNNDGQWTENGIIQTKNVAPGSVIACSNGVTYSSTQTPYGSVKPAQKPAAQPQQPAPSTPVEYDYWSELRQASDYLESRGYTISYARDGLAGFFIDVAGISGSFGADIYSGVYCVVVSEVGTNNETGILVIPFGKLMDYVPSIAEQFIHCIP